MDDTLNHDLLTISEWGRANKVGFNARKTQCCMLTHRAVDSALPSVHMGAIDIEESDTLDVLGMKINFSSGERSIQVSCFFKTVQKLLHSI